MTNGAMRLRELERTAKAAKTGMWVNYVPQATNQTKLSDTYTGELALTVLVVLNGLRCFMAAYCAWNGKDQKASVPLNLASILFLWLLGGTA